MQTAGAAGAASLERCFPLNIDTNRPLGNIPIPPVIDGAKMARTKGATKIGEAERRIIRIALVANEPISTIAEALGRTRQAVWQQVKVMKARGDFAQHVLPLSGDMGADDGKE